MALAVVFSRSNGRNPTKNLQFNISLGLSAALESNPKPGNITQSLGIKKSPKTIIPKPKIQETVIEKLFRNQVQKNLVMPFLHNWSRTASVDLSRSRLVKVLVWRH